MSIFNGLGRALRWLRDRQGKRQYQVADAAGITKAMLSAYETGKQKPSLDTLEKILAALECDLNDLHNALQIVNERPEAIRRTPGGRDPWQGHPTGSGQESGGGGDSGGSVYRVLGLRRQLPALEEQALSEMLEGFHKLVRYLHGMIPVAVSEPEPEEEPS
jgi:transcriptional regulator with XRE-family HTH domain